MVEYVGIVVIVVCIFYDDMRSCVDLFFGCRGWAYICIVMISDKNNFFIFMISQFVELKLKKLEEVAIPPCTRAKRDHFTQPRVLEIESWFEGHSLQYYTQSTALSNSRKLRLCNLVSLINSID
ncbi:hypothetical protein ACJX0J_012429, partial [Zea mays]